MTTVKQETLDDCPFCGGKAALVDYGLEYPDEPIKYQVLCCNGIKHAGTLCDTAEEAIKEWNTRAKTKREAVLVAELESEKKLSEHWRKVAYELGGVTEEQVKEFITQQALAQMEGE